MAHKRTFFYLEQLILKHGADEQCVNIKEMHEVRGPWCGRTFSHRAGCIACSKGDARGAGEALVVDRRRSWVTDRQWDRMAVRRGMQWAAQQEPPAPADTSASGPLVLQGVDFYFANRAHAVKFIDFLQTVVPIRYRCACDTGAADRCGACGPGLCMRWLPRRVLAARLALLHI